MIIAILKWWLATALLGALALPIAWKVLHRLPDRGISLSRPLGILIAGYLLWIGASLGAVRNNLAGVLSSIFVLLVISLWIGYSSRHEIAQWLRDQFRTLATIELLFIFSFLLWTLVRVNNPDISFTEKPMELAFLNSVLRSESFPPNDPWLSGFAISYYYFGYILLGNLTMITGVLAGEAFNLGNALWFAMTAVAAYGLVYNLLHLRNGRPRRIAAFLGPIFVLISGNLEAFFDVLHARQFFWRMTESGLVDSGFWRWLDIKQLVEPPVGDPSWIPSRFLWWWRASRVVRDVNLDGVDIEVIDEFPMFSFVLADNHPHVLALPFVLLALGYALHAFLKTQRAMEPVHKLFDLTDRQLRTMIAGIATLAALTFLVPEVNRIGGQSSLLALETVRGIVLYAGIALLLTVPLLLVLAGRMPIVLSRSEFIFSAWLFGALAFLNTWDLPIYWTILVAAVWWGLRGREWGEQIKLTAFSGITILTLGILLYLPWYPTFTSQAGGVLPNLVFPTKFIQFLIMFGPLLIPIAFWIIIRVVNGWRRSDLRILIGSAIGFPLVLLLVSILFAMVAALVLSDNPFWLDDILREVGAANLQEALRVIGERRSTRSITVLALALIVGSSVLLLYRRVLADRGSEEIAADEVSNPWPFVVLLVATGGLLIIGPEFIYLRDLFQTRMNTIFKFYYAAWVLWGIAAAYAAIEIWPTTWNARSAVRLVAYVPLLLGLIYPVLATWTKTEGFNPASGRALDGTQFLAQTRPDDFVAVQWMNENLAPGIIAEAVGGSYSDFGRISTHTGFPTVLGWDFHEIQWRGSAETQGSRREDIARLYESRNWSEAEEVMERYGIQYVYVGPLERSTYTRLVESKFEAEMRLVYRDTNVAVYALTGSAGQE